MKTTTRLLLVGASGCLMSAPALAQVIVVDRSEPDLDRWNYPFNTTPGTRETAPSFGAINTPGFDDRDSQFLIGFDLSSEVPTGQPLANYRVLSATVTATVSNDMDFQYDPTPDSWVNFVDSGDPDYVPDADAGQAVTIWGTGYRNGFDMLSYTETSVFGGVAAVPPAQGARNAFAAEFDSAGVATDVSNNLKERFDPTPLGIGVAPLAAGADVPVDTVFTFELDLCGEGTLAFLRESLQAGQLNLSISSLQLASGDPGGGGGVIYPVWYTRENAIALLLGYAPTLHLEVRVGNPADLNGDGTLNLDDLDTFVSAFLIGDLTADLDGNCVLNLDDLDAFVSAFLGG